jgi:hypothetical protein
MAAFLSGGSMRGFTFVFLCEGRCNFDELEDAIMGKRIKKGPFSLLPIPFETRRVIGELLAPLLIGVFEIMSEHVVPSADHIVDGLLVNWVVQIVLKLS